MPARSTQRQLDETHERGGKRDLLGPASAPELSEQKQRQIVEGASKVLWRNGFHGASIRDITKACGMSMGQLYHYISSRTTSSSSSGTPRALRQYDRVRPSYLGGQDRRAGGLFGKKGQQGHLSRK